MIVKLQVHSVTSASMDSLLLILPVCVRWTNFQLMETLVSVVVLAVIFVLMQLRVVRVLTGISCHKELVLPTAHPVPSTEVINVIHVQTDAEFVIVFSTANHATLVSILV